jgi:sulfur carrier protein
LEPDTVSTGVGKVYKIKTLFLRAILSLLSEIKSSRLRFPLNPKKSRFGVFMQIKLNGKTLTSTSHTLMELVEEQGFHPEHLIAEVNLEIIKQKEWKSFPIKDGDTIELLSFVEGG